jgi:hypothetical protein
VKKIIFIFVFSASQSFAAVPQLYNLSTPDVDLLSKEFSADFVHTIAAPASSYGKLLGFEVGLLAGMTKTPAIDKISKTISSSAGVTMIPAAGLIAGVSAPLGIGAELCFIPKISGSSVAFQNTSLAFKWTFTDIIAAAPVDVAFRVHGNLSELSYSSIVNNASTANLPVTTKATWKNTSTGYNFEVSKKFLFIEPYFGLGSVSTKTKIGVSAATTVQIFTFTNATDYTSNNSGSHYYAGLNMNLFLFKIGAEYAKIMNVTKAVAKLSFYF